MKQLLLMLLVLPVSAFSQVVVKNSTTVGSEKIIGTTSATRVMISKLTYDVAGTDTTFLLTLIKGKNTFVAEYQVFFFASPKAVNEFYDAVKAVFKEGNEYKKELDVNGLAVVLSYLKEKGNVYAQLTTPEGVSVITEKQWEQTFGRSK